MERIFLSWNVNGLRAVEKKGFKNWLLSTGADIIALQETKCLQEQLPESLKNVPGYNLYLSSPERKGYSGVGIFCKEKPIQVTYDLGIKEFDIEGRFIMLEYKTFYFINCYFPNGGRGDDRIAYKLRFYEAFLKLVKKLSKQKFVITCGDVNTAHKEIDLEHPKENQNTTGFLPSERAWLDKFFDEALVDTFRIFNKEPKQYTWWDYKTAARSRNVGWRLDYFMVDFNAAKHVKNAAILKDVMGSDHAPVSLTIDL